MKVDDLLEIDDIGLFKNFIKQFFIDNEQLFRLVWFADSNALDESICSYPDDPYQLFIPSKEHGCVLFRRKNNEILSEECVNILIDFHTASLSREYDMVYIIFRIIIKGDNIQELSNGINRSFAIMKLMDNEFNRATINGLGEVKKEKIRDLNINEQNVGYTCIYSGHSFSSDYLNNKNIQKQLRGDS
jgi:hypothetical protein